MYETDEETLEHFSGLSINEIRTIMGIGENVLASKIKDEKKVILSKIKELAASVDLSIEVSDVKKEKPDKPYKKVAPKYEHPDDPSIQWSGRGVTPGWVKEAEENGLTREDLLIKI